MNEDTNGDMRVKSRRPWHCWNCDAELEEKDDTILCARCFKWYKCKKCGKCLCDKPKQ